MDTTHFVLLNNKIINLNQIARVFDSGAGTVHIYFGDGTFAGSCTLEGEEAQVFWRHMKAFCKELPVSNG